MANSESLNRKSWESWDSILRFFKCERLHLMKYTVDGICQKIESVERIKLWQLSAGTLKRPWEFLRCLLNKNMLLIKKCTQPPGHVEDGVEWDFWAVMRACQALYFLFRLCVTLILPWQKPTKAPSLKFKRMHTLSLLRSLSLPVPFCTLGGIKSHSKHSIFPLSVLCGCHRHNFFPRDTPVSIILKSL